MRGDEVGVLLPTVLGGFANDLQLARYRILGLLVAQEHLITNSDVVAVPDQRKAAAVRAIYLVCDPRFSKHHCALPTATIGTRKGRLKIQVHVPRTLAHSFRIGNISSIHSLHHVVLEARRCRYARRSVLEQSSAHNHSNLRTSIRRLAAITRTSK